MGYKSPHFYTLEANGALQSTVTDAGVRFFGHLLNSNTTATGGLRRMYILKPGFVRCAVADFNAVTEVGTNETFNCYVRLNDTTDYLIAAVATTNIHRIFRNCDMRVPVVAGDYIEFKFIYPTWATNPTDVYVSGTVLIECE